MRPIAGAAPPLTAPSPPFAAIIPPLTDRSFPAALPETSFAPMSNVLFLGLPSHGHINPTLGLVSELVRRGERVVYFASPAFKNDLERAGAEVRFYGADLDLFTQKGKILDFLSEADHLIGDMLEQIEDETFEYIVHSAAFPFAAAVQQILQVPNISSLAVFAGLNAFMEKPLDDLTREAYANLKRHLSKKYAVTLPDNPYALLFNTGVINLVYTSKFFAAPLTDFDDTFKFVGPPVYDRGDHTGFPFERLQGKKVLYISLGTVFSQHNPRLYDVFTDAFAGWDGIVVMAAYNVGNVKAPDNFIVRPYVPQNQVLQRATAAITHAGMNSLNDLIHYEVPFVSLPMGADQPLLAKRAAELGATIVLDARTVTAEALKTATQRVVTDPDIKESLARIHGSFEEAGGYPWAVAEIFAAVKERAPQPRRPQQVQ